MLKYSKRYSRKKSKGYKKKSKNKVKAIHNKQKSRKRSLKKAVKVYGKNVVIKKINDVRVLNKNTNPKISEIYTKDLHYVKSLFKE